MTGPGAPLGTAPHRPPAPAPESRAPARPSPAGGVRWPGPEDARPTAPARPGAAPPHRPAPAATPRIPEEPHP